ncbi:hypothetical protein [Mesorhizobium sp. M0701]|uniref:hypothetical protein n=1 Tax=Mesorhizobium sp. M0701 TaxID=2956989 RepID=UPI00333525D2
MTRSRSATEPTIGVSEDGTGSRPVTSWPRARRRGAKALPSQPDDPVSKIRILSTSFLLSMLRHG